MPTILGANSVSGYDISNSLRFNDGDSPQLNLANVGTVTNNKIFTYSVWIKKSSIESANQSIVSAESGNNRAQLLFRSGSNDAIRIVETSNAYTSFNTLLTTAALFRDPSAFYHIVLSYDSTDGTAGDRVKIYVNSVLQTLSGTTADENFTTPFNEESYNLDIGHLNNSEFLDGYMSDAHLIDGQALTPTSFGETNDNGVWIPKKYLGSYGLNGFKLEFKQTGTSTNSSGIGADTSGNDRHFAVSNLAATDVTEDTPTNNFATLSSIDTHTTSPTLAEGNLDFTGIANTAFTPARSTIAVSQGKWYMEYKFKTAGGGVGVMTTQSPINDHLRDDADVRSIYRGHNGYYYGRNNSGAIDDVGGNSVTLSENDIVGVALDLDNGYVYFSKNGTYMNGQDGSTAGNPASNNGGSGGAANHPSQLLTNQHDGVWGFMAYDISTSTAGRVICNFGNIPSTVGSPNTDGKYGDFYYAPPSGFYALCTKRLAEFG